MAVNVKSETVTINYEEYVGDTLSIKLTWKDAAGNPFDLTSHSALLNIKVLVSDTSPLLTLTSAAGGVVLGNSTDNITVIISDTQTATLGKGKYVYALELTEPSGNVNTLVVGTIILIQSAI